MEIKSAKDLRVYQKAYALAMQVYEPRFTIKHHLLRYAYFSSLRRT